MSSPNTFLLAPMSGLLRGLTWLVLGLPLVFVGLAVASPLPGPMYSMAALLTGLYASVWLFLRPTAFTVSPRGVTLLWPLRQRLIPTEDVEGAEEVSMAQLRAEFGRLMRVGAGGLWGGFGLGWASRGNHVGLWVSRHADGYVLLRCRKGRSQLLTPDRPADFVAAVQAVLAQR